MPLEEVFVERGGVVVFGWVFGEFVGFPDCRLLAELERGWGGGRTDPLDCGRLCVECLGHSSFLSMFVLLIVCARLFRFAVFRFRMSEIASKGGTDIERSTGVA